MQILNFQLKFLKRGFSILFRDQIKDFFSAIELKELIKKLFDVCHEEYHDMIAPYGKK